MLAAERGTDCQSVLHSASRCTRTGEGATGEIQHPVESFARLDWVAEAAKGLRSQIHSFRGAKGDNGRVGKPGGCCVIVAFRSAKGYRRSIQPSDLLK